MARTTAVIDVGSNTVRLLVACRGDAGLEPIYDDRIRLGLAREIEEDGRLSEATVAAASEAVRRLASRARSHSAESIQILVTAPGRQAQNGAELGEAIARAVRLPVRLLSPEDEARLAFAGAVAAAAPTAPLVAVVDLGGASTEIAVGRPEAGPAWYRSVDLGALRLASRLLDTDDPDRDEIEAAAAAVGEAFAAVAPPLPAAALAIGGSARALGSVLGPRLGSSELAIAAALLPMCPPKAIVRRFGVGRHRAPLLLAASLILAEVQRRLAVPLLVTEGSVREGALVLAERHAAAA